MDRYDNGIHVVTVQLQDVVPPKAVRPAFNEVNEARQERERMITEDTKQANQRAPLARGQANRVLAQAEGYATERVNKAQIGRAAGREGCVAVRLDVGRRWGIKKNTSITLNMV